MKCIKNAQTGNVIRVADIQADQMVGRTWQFVPKSEWKAQTRAPKTEQQEEVQEKKEKTLSSKAAKRSKLGAKQRPADSTVNYLNH